jgi:putative membrane protein
MANILLRWFFNAVAIGVTTLVLGGIRVDEEGASTPDRLITLLLVAAVFGLVNAVIKPVVKFFAFPLYLLTLGLITFVVNALMLLLTSWISDQVGLVFEVVSFLDALLGAAIISIVSWILSLVVDRR